MLLGIEIESNGIGVFSQPFEESDLKDSQIMYHPQK